MFRKLVSNLKFSPSLIHQFGFYSARLRKEQLSRKISLIFTVFAIIIQALIIYSPPQSTNAEPYQKTALCSDDSRKNSANCLSDLEITKQATNLSQGKIDATKIAARPHDTIIYNIKIKNPTNQQIKTEFTDDLSDILEYSEIINQGDGEFNNTNKTITWKNLVVEARSSIEENFLIKIKNKIPATATGLNNKNSQDCKMTSLVDKQNPNTKVEIAIKCPPEKLLESEIIQQLPKINITTNLIFSGAILLIVVFFYARSLQLEKEIRLIRQEFNRGNLGNNYSEKI